MSYRPSTRLNINITPAKINYLLGKYTYSSADAFKKQLDVMLDEALALTIIDIEKWIGKGRDNGVSGLDYVPKRTGQMRDSLIDNLKSSRVRGTKLRLKLGTHLDYIKYVAKMSQDQVRHSGDEAYAYYYGNYGKIKLNDNKAQGEFWGKLLLAAKAYLIKNWKATYQAYARGTGESARPLSTVRVQTGVVRT